MFPIKFAMGLLVQLVPLIHPAASQAVTEVRIEPDVGTLLVPSGERLVLNCSVTNHVDKEETITWVAHYNKARLEDIRRDVSQVKNSDGNYTSKKELIIETFSAEYDGKFQCVYVPGHGSKKEASIELTTIIGKRNLSQILFPGYNCSAEVLKTCVKPKRPSCDEYEKFFRCHFEECPGVNGTDVAQGAATRLAFTAALFWKCDFTAEDLQRNTGVGVLQRPVWESLTILLAATLCKTVLFG